MHTYWILFSLGTLISLIGYIWLVVVGFNRSVVWGLLVLFFSPISAIIFAATNWYSAKKAFLVYAASMVLIIGASVGFYSQFAPLFEQTMKRVQNGELTKEEAQRQLTYALMNGQTSLPPVKSDASHEPGQSGSDTHVGKTAAKRDAVVTSDKGKESEKAEKTIKAIKAEKTADVSADEQRAPPSIPNLNQVQPDPLVQKSKVPSDKVVVSLHNISSYVGRFFIITLKNGTEHRGLLRKVDSTKLVLDRKLYGGNFVYRVHKDEIRSILMLKRIPME